MYQGFFSPLSETLGHPQIHGVHARVHLLCLCMLCVHVYTYMYVDNGELELGPVRLHPVYVSVLAPLLCTCCLPWACKAWSFSEISTKPQPRDSAVWDCAVRGRSYSDPMSHVECPVWMSHWGWRAGQSSPAPGFDTGWSPMVQS